MVYLTFKKLISLRDYKTNYGYFLSTVADSLKFTRDANMFCVSQSGWGYEKIL